MSLQWERIVDEPPSSHTDRLPVIGGWIVRTRISARNEDLSTVFVPDPEHEWKVEL